MALKSEERWCIHERFEAQVARTPLAIAAVLDEAAITYDVLNRKANRIAHRLSKLGVGPEIPVVISVERSLDMLAGVLGILKAGGAYVPLDPLYPRDRLAFVLSDTRAPVLVTQTSLREALPGSEIAVVCLDEGVVSDRSADEVDAGNPASGVEPDNLAYIIYTSGSTGRPKGVCIEHGTAVKHLADMQHVWQLDAYDRVLQFASLSFDASVEQIFSTLFSGACLVLRGVEGWDPGHFSRYATDAGLTVADLPTAYWDRWVQEYAGREQTVPPRLRLVIVGGEAVTADSVRRWKASPLRHIRLVNGYGPTETTITASTFEITPRLADTGPLDSVPIGRPLAGRTLHLLDSDGRPVAPGAAGELYLGGEGLARGYLNQPSLTAERFIPDPFSPNPRARLYRTGDLARYRSDNEIEFLGRVDHQVKIRGFRVELGEIEERLRQHPGVAQAVAMVREDVPCSKQLVAYVVSSREHASTPKELEEHLARQLPYYMVPAAVLFLDDLPVTPNGKIDRAALPSPRQVDRPTAETYVPPRNHAEEVLCDIWAQVLDVDRVSVVDRFVDMGGDSLSAMLVVARALEAGLDITAGQFGRAATVAELASVAIIAPNPSARREPGQEAEAGPVPFTPKLHYYFSDTGQHSRGGIESVSFDAREPIDAGLLEDALHAVVARHDALRLRFSQGPSGKQAHTVLHEDHRLVETIQFEGLSESDRQAVVAEVSGAMPGGIDLEEGPLVRLVLLKQGTCHPDHLVVFVHHVAFDAYSEAIILEDLEVAYRCLVHGQMPRWPATTTSFRRWAEHLKEHAQAKTTEEQLESWLQAPWPKARRLRIDGRTIARPTGRVRTLKCTLGFGPTRTLLRDVPRVLDAQVPDVLVAALAQALAGWTKKSSVLIGLKSHGREPLSPDVDVSRTVGWFSSSCPVSIEVTGTNAAELLPSVREQVRKAGARGVRYGLLRCLCDDERIAERIRRIPEPRIDVNYLGQVDGIYRRQSLFDRAQNLLDMGLPPQTSVRTFDTLRLKAHVLQGRLHLALRYHENAYRRKNMKRLMRTLVEAVHEIIRACA
jgi:amino acid adenylation domain-containing protein/non-ribosomal peptide synthase protein (TIGR01720 family)